MSDDSERHRHECEVRYLLRMPNREARARYLDGLARWRAPEAIKRLRDDVTRAWIAQRWPPSPPREQPPARSDTQVHSPTAQSGPPTSDSGSSPPPDPEHRSDRSEEHTS